MNLNPFLANVSILYPLKTLVNQRFSGIFREYKIGKLARNGLNFLIQYQQLMLLFYYHNLFFRIIFIILVTDTELQDCKTCLGILI